MSKKYVAMMVAFVLGGAVAYSETGIGTPATGNPTTGPNVYGTNTQTTNSNGTNLTTGAGIGGAAGTTTSTPSNPQNLNSNGVNLNTGAGISGAAGTPPGTTANPQNLNSNGVNMSTGAGITSGTPLQPPPLPNAPLSPAQFRIVIQQRLDTNNDGIISAQEWGARAPQLFMNDQTSASTFATWDRNLDGKIDGPELQAIFGETGGANLFQLYDTNNDSVIDPTEAARIPAQ